MANSLSRRAAIALILATTGCFEGDAASTGPNDHPALSSNAPPSALAMVDGPGGTLRSRWGTDAEVSERAPSAELPSRSVSGTSFSISSLVRTTIGSIKQASARLAADARIRAGRWGARSRTW